MMEGDGIARLIAAQLTAALAFVLAHRLQAILPDLPGSAIATIIFIPSLVRVGATLYCGPIAFLGLFAGSLLIASQAPQYQPNALWHAFASAMSAPLTYFIFARLGLFPPRGQAFQADAAVILPFIMSYAVMNAGLHLIGLSVLTSDLAPHLPFFLTMVVGDLIPPVMGFALFRLIKRVFWSGTLPKH